jgi:hypothetical protein
MHFTLMMEAARPYEMLVSCYNTTRWHNPEDFSLNPYYHENLHSQAGTDLQET